MKRTLTQTMFMWMDLLVLEGQAISGSVKVTLSPLSG